MNMHTSYPVFESGQVLSSGHLNDLVNYLEQQDRLTRNKLIGIGIACGFAVSYDPKQDQIRIGKGCAVTSEGYLICADEALLDRFRDYAVPVPSVEEAPEDLVAEARYPFFFEGEKQIPLWELLATEFEPAPGDPAPSQISDAFLSDKVVLLFLECNLESLKNCDINDCSDKGAEMNFTLRRLLITKDAAKAILEQEQKLADRPVDRFNHPRYALKELAIEKINPSRHGIDNFSELFARIDTIASDTAPKLKDALGKSYDAYRYMLSDLYPATQFANGPFGVPGYFDNVLHQGAVNPFLVQYFYDYLLDAVQAYNEFLRTAIKVEAECCPNPDRFPKHVLLGEVKERPTAFAPPLQPDWAKFDQNSADTGLGPAAKPAAFRHHFIPSKLVDRQHAGLRHVRALHYRLYLLAYRYRAADLMKAELRITPSKSGDYPLSDKAIPFYYAFKPGDDLHRTWSYRHTSENLLDQVFSHQFIEPDPAKHPLGRRMERHNFYRVEGIVGKPLGTAMAELLEQKRQLGLSFGIEPVFLGIDDRSNVASGVLDKEARARALKGMLALLVCRLRDLDVVFLVLMGLLFYYLMAIITLLSRLNTAAVAGAPRTAVPVAGQLSAEVALARATPLRVSVDKKLSEATLKEIQGKTYVKGQITERVISVKDARASIGQLYSEIKPTQASDDLFDRTREFVRKLGVTENLESAAQRVYRPISLINQTEELIATVRAKSLAEFDFDDFDAKYDGFATAFDAYVAEAPGDTDAEVAGINQSLMASYGAVAETTPNVVVANLVREMRQRLNALFQELTFKAYAQKHPGMEHKAGVPVGGTLVLLYTHKGFLGEVMEGQTESFNQRTKELFKKYAAKWEAQPMASPIKLLSGFSAGDGALDEFIVLGDFCVPYLCCDADCSDIDLRTKSVSEPEPTIIKGTVFGRAAVEGRTANPAVLAPATLTVTNLATNQPVKVTMKEGSYAFTVPPGTYRIEAAAAKFKGQTRIVTVGAAGTPIEDFVLLSA